MPRIRIILIHNHAPEISIQRRKSIWDPTNKKIS